MPDEEGRLTAYMRQLRDQLEHVRLAVAENPPTPAEVLDGELVHGAFTEAVEGEETLPSDLQGAPSEVGAWESAETTRAAREAASTEARDPVSVEDVQKFEGSCSRCGGELGDDPFVGVDGVLCDACGGSRSSPSPPPPWTEWKQSHLTVLGNLILTQLEEVYPEELSARELTERLPDKRFGPSFSGKSAVNSELYGSINEWVEKEGETPPYWSLKARPEPDTSDNRGEERPDRPSNCQDCGVSLGDEIYIGETGVLCAECASAAARADAENGEPQRARGEGADVIDTTVVSEGNAQDASEEYALCAICMTEKPNSDMTHVGDRVICSRCLSGLYD